YLSTGHAPGHGSASGQMAEVVSNSLRFLTREDIASIGTYLKTTRPVHEGVPAPVNTAGTRAAAIPDFVSGDQGMGARTFAGACIGCHAWDGSGLQSDYATV